MKRNLLTAIAVCAAGAASAQSSVTLFGIVDTGVGIGHGNLSHRTQLYNAGGNATSRLGFRGTEDLGGGMSASFWLEGQVNVDDGTGAATNNNNQPPAAAAAAAGTQGFSFGRRSTVSLAGSWGEVRLGRDYTAHYRNRVDVDPFGNVGVGTIQPQVATIGGVTSTRASNMVGYFTPASLGGFYGTAQYYAGENLSTSANPDDGKGYSALAGYEKGPVKVALAYGKTSYARTAALGDIKVANIGASYDFGAARLMAGYFRDKLESLAPVAARGFALGTIVPVAGAHQIKAAYSRYSTDAAGSPSARKLSLGWVDNLSRRTAIYATYARVNNKGGAAFALNGSTTAPNSSSSGFDVGLRHSF